MHIIKKDLCYKIICQINPTAAIYFLHSLHGQLCGFLTFELFDYFVGLALKGLKVAKDCFSLFLMELYPIFFGLIKDTVSVPL